MSTKKKKQSLEIEVLIPDEILTANDDLNNHYDKKSKKLSYLLNEDVSKETIDKLSDILVNSQAKELVQLNPAVEALIDLQELKNLKYDPENRKESSQEYKDGKKMIGAFNTAIGKVKKVLKQPHIDYNRSVDEIYKIFKSESDATKKAITENFDAYLKEEEAKKKAREDKKKQAELDRIKELAEQNKEQEEKLKNQQKRTSELEMTTAIDKILLTVNDAISNLNEEGLNSYKSKIQNMTFNQEVNVPDDLFKDSELKLFVDRFAEVKGKALMSIGRAIQSIKDKEESDKISNENAVLKASTPNVLMPEEDDDPFAGINTSGQESLEIDQQATDAHKLQAFIDYLSHLDKEVDSAKQAIASIDFNNDDLKIIQDKIANNSFPVVKEYTSKMLSWMLGKQELYINSLTVNK